MSDSTGKVWRNAEGLTFEEIKARAAQHNQAADAEPDAAGEPRTARNDGLTAAEGAVMDALSNAAIRFVGLPVQHSNEPADFVDAVRRCQALLAVRVARRAFPAGWPERPT